MASVTWLHISDWHQTVYRSRVDRHRRRKVVVELLRDIKQLRGHPPRIDFMVFSGDIAQGGLVDEYDEALRGLCLPLCRFTKVPEDRCFVVAGNHDLDRKVLESLPYYLQKPTSALTFDTRRTDALVTSAASLAKLRSQFENFRNFATRFRVDADWAYSEAFSTASGIDVEISALNSSLYCGRKNAAGETQDYGGLFVGGEQLDVLGREPARGLNIGNGALRIAILHHPFAWFYQAEQARLQEGLFDKAHFILVGHEHNQRVEEVLASYGDVVIIPAGPCFDQGTVNAGDTGDRYGMAYNIVTLTRDGSQWAGRIWPRRWHGTERKFHGDVRYPIAPGGAYQFRAL